MNLINFIRQKNILSFQVIFWAGFLLTVLTDLSTASDPFHEFIFKLSTLLVDLGLGYFHALILFPILLEKKQWRKYFLFTSSIIVAYPFLMNTLISLRRAVINHYPFQFLEIYPGFFIRPIIIVLVSIPFYLGIRYFMQNEEGQILKRKKAQMQSAKLNLTLFLSLLQKQMQKVTEIIKSQPEESVNLIEEIAGISRAILRNQPDNQNRLEEEIQLALRYLSLTSNPDSIQIMKAENDHYFFPIGLLVVLIEKCLYFCKSEGITINLWIRAIGNYQADIWLAVFGGQGPNPAFLLMEKLKIELTAVFNDLVYIECSNHDTQVLSITIRPI